MNDQKIDIESALKLIEPDGALSKSLMGFESREAQQKMMQSIIEAYHNNAIALIEAGTGTGKSIAYLIPAMLWAAKTKERTLISTNTISLQEQLIHKDIPLLTKALNLELKAVLVKGMNNYLCLRKLEDAKHELRLMPVEESEELDRIDKWKHTTTDGSRSDLPFVPSGATWERVGAETDTCNHQECPHYQQCFFFKARRKANDAHLLVANHHMLFADLACRAETNNYKNPSVLPLYSRIVIDEAHNIEDIATDYFANRVTRLGVLRTLSRLNSERQGKAYGKLTVLKEKMYEFFGREPSKHESSILAKLNIDLPGLRNDLLLHTGNAFQAYANFVEALQPTKRHSHQDEGPSPGENKLRVLAMHKTHPDWNREIVPHAKRFIDALDKYVQALNALESELLLTKNDRFKEQTQGIRFDITALAARLMEAREVIAHFINENEDISSVRWIESQALRALTNIQLVNADLDIAKRLSESLFSKFSTIILCSATLSTNKQFQFIRNRLGITKERLSSRHITEHLYDSPFNYQQQALFVVPLDIPNPLDTEFTQVAAERIWQAIQASRGNAFILFTSYSMLKTCHQILERRLLDNRYTIFKQGDDNRNSLLNRFKTTDHSVLFGTDSFWEGVDVVGDALRCVIIVKLPFKVPTEPIIQARTEAIAISGGDPFMDYSLPNAIVKFKQGFGRLIRNKKDRGCIVCLDNRLIHKGYGRQFLNSLPPCQIVFAESNVLQKQMTDFYRATHHLVNKQ